MYVGSNLKIILCLIFITFRTVLTRATSYGRTMFVCCHT